MPRGDGTGPPRTGGGGRMRGDRVGSGPGGQCVCPACGARVAHQVGTPCNNRKCPKCGAAMTRG